MLNYIQRYKSSHSVYLGNEHVTRTQQFYSAKKCSWTYSFKSTKISNWFRTCKMWRLNQALSDIWLVANFQVLHVEALQLYIVQSHLETWFACFLSQNMHKWGCYLQKDRKFSPSLNSRVQTNRTYTSARFRPSSHKCIFKEMQFCWCIFTKTAPQ